MLVLSIVLLLIAFRSLLIPVQAAMTNLLCVGAAFGVLVATFQWGWGLDLVGLSTPYGTVAIASYVPLIGRGGTDHPGTGRRAQHQGATAGGAPPDGEGHADGRLPDQTMPTTHAWPEPSTPVHEPTAPADGHRDHAPDD